MEGIGVCVEYFLSRTPLWIDCSPEPSILIRLPLRTLCSVRGQLGAAEASRRTDDKARSDAETRLAMLQNELRRMQDDVASNYVPRADVDGLQRDLEARAKADLNRKLVEVNRHLESQAQAHTAVEQRNAIGMFN
jgi:hypothetical protein